LESLSHLPQFEALDVVVANCCGAATQNQIVERFAGITVVELPPLTSIADARHAAIQQTSGDLIAVLQERYCVRGNWLDQLRSTHAAQGADVVAGTVGPSSALSVAQWAIFLTEYTHVAPPARTGWLDRSSACMIPGGNVSYTRAVFQKASMARRLWELDFHAALYDSGARFYRDGAIVAEFGYPHPVREYIAERFDLSRQFAARRAADKRLMVRCWLAVSCLALPLLVVSRIAGAVLRKRVYRGRFLRVLPWIVAFSIVQACGEMAGTFTATGVQHQSVSHESAPGPQR
jgi:hypothetical protein